jgi:hypothetical protein
MAIALSTLNNKSSITGSEKIPVSGSGNPSITPNILKTFLTPFVTPEQYGAVGDGTTNDQAAIQLAVDSGLPVYFGKKTYVVSTTVTIAGNVRVIGSGASSIIKTTANIPIFTVTGTNNQISHLTFEGSQAGGIGSTQRGIIAVGNAGFTLHRYFTLLDNCKFKNLFDGIYTTFTIGSSGDHQGTFHAINCYFETCGNGVNCDTRGEYNTFSNCTAYDCTIGFRNYGGNNNWNGGQIIECTTGVYIGTGTNDGHGVVSGCKINHNGSAVTSVSTANGYLFTGCMIYAGSVTLTTTTGIKFNACEFSFAPLTCTNSTLIEFSNCKYIENHTLSITGTAPRFFNNTYNTGTTHASAFTNGLSGDLSLLDVGAGILIKEGSNAKSGLATMVAGTITVNTTRVTATSRIQLTVQSLGTVTTPKAIGVTARVAGTSFTITSADNTDTSTVAWLIVEPT